jgi:hypothetical protein
MDFFDRRFRGHQLVFDAKITSSSTVTGKARFFEAGGIDIDIVVTCLTVSGNTAIIGGTDADDNTTTYAFKVTDNGGGSPADRITLPQVNQICSTFNTLRASLSRAETSGQRPALRPSQDGVGHRA